MNIVEKDFKIIANDADYTLYVLKSKKELKEDSEDTFKVYGHYQLMESALKAAISFRRDKKYPGKESVSELLRLYKIYILIRDQFEVKILAIYDSISKIKSKIIWKILS